MRWAPCYRGVWPELDGIAGGPRCFRRRSRQARLPLLPTRPPDRLPACQRRSWRGAACREQRLTILGATPTRPTALLPTQPSDRPPPGPPASILHRRCEPRTAAHQPQPHPNPTDHPCCPPGADLAEMLLAANSSPPTPAPPRPHPARHKGNIRTTTRGRRPDNGHPAQKPGTSPNIRKPTHHPGNTATMWDTRPGERRAAWRKARGPEKGARPGERRAARRKARGPEKMPPTPTTRQVTPKPRRN